MSEVTIHHVLEILPVGKIAPFAKDDGEPIQDSRARRTC